MVNQRHRLDDHNVQQVAPRAISQAAASFLLRVVDLSLLAILFIAPLFMGGRHPVGRFVYVALAVVAAVAWLMRQTTLKSAHWTRSPADWLVVALLGLVGLQLVPLPADVLARISPNLAEALPTWTNTGAAGSQFGEWSTVSLAPGATRESLSIIIAMSLILLVVIQRCRELCDVVRVVRWVAFSAAAMALFGMVQWMTTNGKFGWIYEHPYRTAGGVVKGNFINQNHFAHVLALGLGPLIFWITSLCRRTSEKRSRSQFSSSRQSNLTAVFVLNVGLAIVLLAGLLSLSRGGAIAMAVAIFVSMAVLVWVGWLGRVHLAVAFGVMATLATALTIHGHDRVAGELDDLTSGSVETLDRSEGRRKIWQANLPAIQQSPILGTGVGSHREVYPRYLPNPPLWEYTHAESGYVQIATEMGLVGLGLVLLAILILVSRCMRVLLKSRSGSVRACMGAVLAGLVASALHSIFDFVWYIPACMAVTVFLAACAVRLSQLGEADEGRPERTHQLSRLVWVGATAVLVVVSVGLIQTSGRPALAAHHWDSYLRASRVVSQSVQAKLSDRNTNLDFLTNAEQGQRDEAMIHHLSTVIRHDPMHARAHLRLAAHYLRRFDQLQQSSENAMDLSQIRDAAIASQFASSDDLADWLDRAVGDHRRLLHEALWHTRTALRLCPLQGQGYIYLARLCFLEGGGTAEKAVLVSQALLLRPYDGEIRFEAGREAMLLGNVAERDRHWKLCFHAGGIHQKKLVKMLLGHYSLRQWIDEYEPELRDLELLYDHYSDIASRTDVVLLCDRYEQFAERELSSEASERASRNWRFASRVRREIGDHQRSVFNAKRACELDPSDYRSRFDLAVALVADGRFSDARREIKWCHQRQPDDGELRRLLETAIAAGVEKPPPDMSIRRASHTSETFQATDNR